MAAPLTFVLFGATGDLARTKLWPALHDLAASGRLPDDMEVLGISRSASKEELVELAAEHGPEGGRLESSERWDQLLEHVDVVNGAADDPELYEQLQQALEDREGERLTYLSVSPSLFGEIGARLAQIGLGREAGSTSRLVVEKPFGEDLASARELREALHEHFQEEQLLRIDHYLGKETAQNLLVLRFVNGIFEPLWDRRSIESIQITVAEDGGVDGRGDFYDETGALRDVGQNHLLQLLALTLMDAPARVEGDELRAERLKVLRSIVPIEPGAAVLGQYEGYGEEEGVEKGSRTDTYAAMRVEVDSWRWAGVPCYLRTGKRLKTKQAEIAVAFRPSPHNPFPDVEGWAGPNRLIIGIQPGERVQLHVTGKRPGTGVDLVKVALDFDAGDAADEDAPEAYTRLIGDAIAGDTTLFTSSAEVEAQWTAVEPLLRTAPTRSPTRRAARGPTRRRTSRVATAAAGGRWMATTEARPAARAAPRDPGLRAALSRPAVLVPVLVGLAAAIATAAASAAALARTLPVEDAFYALAVSRNVALGHGISADGLAHTNGFQPLWVVLNTPLYLLAGGDRIAGLRLSQVLSTVLWLGFVVLLAAQARALARRHGATGAVAAAAAAIVAAGSVSVFRIFHNGLETGLTLDLLAGCVLLLDATRRWSVPRVLAAGALLGALAWARLDAVAYVAAFGLVVLVRDRRAALRPLLACVLAALLLAPWLAYNISLDGSPMPSSGKAEGGFVDVGHNLDSALRAAGDWAAPPVLRSSMHYNPLPLAELLSVLAIGLVIAAVVLVRRRARPPLGNGTVALLLFVVFLLGWYTLHFGAWWFEDRYLAPLLLLTVPWAATALELGRPRARALGVLSAIVLVLNVPVLVLLATGPTWRPPGWSSPATNLGSHTNLNYEQQLAWVQRHVAPNCIVGGFEAGTMLYFRDRVVNLDGKVNHDALVAANSGRTPQYVDARRIDVLDDIDSGIARALRGRSAQWRRVSDGVRYDAWVRRGREGACLR